MANNICRVCGHQFKGIQCDHCGWFDLHIPPTAPQLIKDLFEQQAALMAKCLAAANAPAPSTNDSQLVEQYKKEAEQARAEAAQTYEKAHDIYLKAKNIKEKYIQLQDEHRQLQEQMAKQPQSIPIVSAPCGVVLIEDVDSHQRLCLPVYEGTNTYGAAPSSALHQQIAIGDFDSRPAVLFAVKRTPQGMAIKPANDVALTCRDNEINRTVYTAPTDDLYIDKRLKINIYPL